MVDTKASDTLTPPSHAMKVVEKARQWTRDPPLTPKLLRAGQQAIAGGERSMLVWKAQRYRFLPRKLSEMRVVDVRPLLQEYKHLASSCDQLLAERETLLARVLELEAGSK